MHNSFSLRTFLEFYTIVPLVLIALAGTYKFGYFQTLDSLWILPSISAYSLFYSILVTILLFILGTVLSLIFQTISYFFGYLYTSLFFIILIAFIFILMSNGLNLLIALLAKLTPLCFGFFYYFYVHSSMFGNELEKNVSAPLTLLLSIFAFGGMYISGSNDAVNAIEKRTLPIVIFDKQTSYPNDQTDWRLLEAIDNRYVLINLNHKTDYGYEKKVVEYSKVDSIY